LISFGLDLGEIILNHGETVLGDTPFSLQVFLDGSIQPICLAVSDNSVATATCEAAGFLDGGRLVVNDDDDKHTINALTV
jgi:hypothetical protein